MLGYSTRSTRAGGGGAAHLLPEGVSEPSPPGPPGPPGPDDTSAAHPSLTCTPRAHAHGCRAAGAPPRTRRRRRSSAPATARDGARSAGHRGETAHLRQTTRAHRATTRSSATTAARRARDTRDGNTHRLVAIRRMALHRLPHSIGARKGQRHLGPDACRATLADQLHHPRRSPLARCPRSARRARRQRAHRFHVPVAHLLAKTGCATTLSPCHSMARSGVSTARA